MECYFEILIPSSKVKRAKDRRDIQVHAGELILSQYKWSLKSSDGELLATPHFMISSEGQAKNSQSDSMGRYTLCDYIVTQLIIPVYKHDENNRFLYRSSDGKWFVSDVVGYDLCYLRQQSNNSALPHKTVP